MNKILFSLVISFALICAAGAMSRAQGMRTCLDAHYPDFKEDLAGWGYMPGPVEQEAICLAEFGGPESQMAADEVKGSENDPVFSELRKLWIMDRIYHRKSDERGESASVFNRNIVRDPPRYYLGIRPGTRTERIQNMDTSSKRERVPDLLHTLNLAKAGEFYIFRRLHERYAAICVEPKEDGTCREIVPKEKYDKEHAKKEEGGFKRFMEEVESPFISPSTKAVTELKTLDFYGVRISDASYSFDHKFSYAGFFARISNREPFAVNESPQYISDVFRALIDQFGEPALKVKHSVSGKPGAFTSFAIWLTDDGFRIDASCENPSSNSGVCREGHISVRRLSPVHSSHSTEGASFFE
jgi:hypothetical protein